MTAPLSPAQAEHLARVEAAEVTPESWANVDRVAQAIADADDCDRVYWPDMYEERALAAILAITDEPRAALRRVLELADELQQEGDECKALGVRYKAAARWAAAASCDAKSWTSRDAARRIRSAVATPAAAATSDAEHGIGLDGRCEVCDRAPADAADTQDGGR